MKRVKKDKTKTIEDDIQFDKSQVQKSFVFRRRDQSRTKFIEKFVQIDAYNTIRLNECREFGNNFDDK